MIIGNGSIKKSEIITIFTLLLIIASGLSQGISILLLSLTTYLFLNKNGSFYYNKSFNIFIYFIIASIFIGILNHSQKQLFFEEILRTTLLLVFLVCVYNYIDDEQKEKIISIISILIIFSFLLFPYLQHHGRFKSFFLHPNHLAYVANIIIYYYLIVSNNSHKKVMTVAMIFILLMTKSSGGILCLSVLLSIFFYSKNKLIFILFGCFTTLIMLFGNDIPVIKVIFDKFNSVDVNNLENKIEKLSFGNDSSLVWRVTYWGALLNQFLGLDFYEKMWGLGYGTMSHGNYYYYWMYTDPHNDYVRKLMETGIAGLTLLLFFWIVFAVKSNYKLYSIPLLFVPMLVGNMIVNIPFLLLLILLGFNRNEIKR